MPRRRRTLFAKHVGLIRTNVNYIYYEALIDAQLGRSADALKLLREAFEKHYPAEFAAGDEDLKSLERQSGIHQFD